MAGFSHPKAVTLTALRQVRSPAPKPFKYNISIYIAEIQIKPKPFKSAATIPIFSLPICKYANFAAGCHEDLLARA